MSIDVHIIEQPLNVGLNDGPLEVILGNDGPTGRSALQHLIGNGTLPVGATEADFETWLRDRAHEAVQDFTFTQSVAATVWTVNHNLGVRPMVDVLDALDRQVTAEVEHASVNQVIVRFAVPQTGSVRCL